MSLTVGLLGAVVVAKAGGVALESLLFGEEQARLVGVVVGVGCLVDEDVAHVSGTEGAERCPIDPLGGVASSAAMMVTRPRELELLT